MYNVLACCNTRYCHTGVAWFHSSAGRILMRRVFLFESRLKIKVVYGHVFLQIYSNTICIFWGKCMETSTKTDWKEPSMYSTDGVVLVYSTDRVVIFALLCNGFRNIHVAMHKHIIQKWCIIVDLCSITSGEQSCLVMDCKQRDSFRSLPLLYMVVVRRILLYKQSVYSNSNSTCPVSSSNSVIHCIEGGRLSLF